MEIHLRHICGSAVLCTILLMTGCEDKAEIPLKSLVNSKNYNLISPAQGKGPGGIFPGGIVVSNGKASTFFGLPTGVPPPGTHDPEPETFPTEGLGTSAQLRALTTGLEKVFPGNPGVEAKKTSQLTVEQIEATSFKVTDQPQDIVNGNPAVKRQIKTWIKDDHFQPRKAAEDIRQLPAPVGEGSA